MFVQPCEFLYDRYVNFVALALLPMMEGIDIPHDRKGGGLIRTSIKSWLRNLISSDISNRFFPRSFWALVVFTLLFTDLRPHCRILQRGWRLSSRSIDWSLFGMSPALHTCPTPRYRDGGVNHPVLTTPPCLPIKLWHFLVCRLHPQALTPQSHVPRSFKVRFFPYDSSYDSFTAKELIRKKKNNRRVI